MTQNAPEDSFEEDEWNKAQRLALAGAVAPVLRSRAASASKRVVGVMDKDGKVVRYTTLSEVQQALLLTKQIELEMGDGAVQKEIVCESCGRLDKAKSKGHSMKRCRACTHLRCAGCNKELPRVYSSPSMVAKRKGDVPRCRPCHLAQKKKLALPKCSTCNKELHRGVRNRKTNHTCKSCHNKARKEASLASAPCCIVCAEPLSYSTRYHGGTTHQRCRTSEMRSTSAKKKMEQDPAFAVHVKETMKKGQEVQKARAHEPRPNRRKNKVQS